MKFPQVTGVTNDEKFYYMLVGSGGIAADGGDRRGAIGDAAIAQLAVAVKTPALDRAAVEHRAAVVLSC